MGRIGGAGTGDDFIGSLSVQVAVGDIHAMAGNTISRP